MSSAFVSSSMRPALTCKRAALRLCSRKVISSSAGSSSTSGGVSQQPESVRETADVQST